MEYVSPIWAGGSPPLLAKLDAIQRRAIKIIGSDEFEFASLAHRRTVDGLAFIHRLLHRTAPPSVWDLCPDPYTKRPTRSVLREARPFFTPPSNRSTDSKTWCRSCIPMFTRAFNNLPTDTQSCVKRTRFKLLASSTNFPELWIESSLRNH